ncbi:LysR family transcriptional regulator [Mangrovicoccus algicola]|uniref:LysR family transcriptional regulator n=1 Tax=Mangrovicoccus algicola TaxID=2771008 RepID=A0A8J7CX90_9RHOB|nr:LysR family transcriptional regulator [Mangrovicoccus algicola]MBE3640289.1 LysR family transcriptional regulator [Mangrovicoccus algicola]
MRFRGLDLNLLSALVVLVDECSVSAAATRLHLSQAATSNALARLRAYFGDPLLVRAGQQMMPTERGRALHREAGMLLRQVEARVLAAPDFDPATHRRDITIIAAEAVALGLMARLSRELTRQAPGLSLTIRPPRGNLGAQLETGAVDLLAVPLKYAAPARPHCLLHDEPFRVLCWRGAGIAAQPMTPELYLGADHVGLHPGADRKMPLDQLMIEQAHGPLRRSVTVSGHAAVPWYLMGTERLATLPGRIARQFADALPLSCRALPFELPQLRLVLQWDDRAGPDACLSWLVGRLQALAAAEDPEGTDIHEIH